MGKNQERLEGELHRLCGYRFKRLLMVRSKVEILAGQYHSNIKPNAVLATVCAFEMRCDSRSCFYRRPRPAETQVSVRPSYLASECLRVPKAGRSPLGKKPRRAARSKSNAKPA
jgi:hypothetical protein